MSTGADTLPDDIDALRAALLAERAARHQAEARATGAEAMIAHLKVMIAKLQRDRFGPTSERSRRLLDQLELGGPVAAERKMHFNGWCVAAPASSGKCVGSDTYRCSCLRRACA